MIEFIPEDFVSNDPTIYANTDTLKSPFERIPQAEVAKIPTNTIETLKNLSTDYPKGKNWELQSRLSSSAQPKYKINYEIDQRYQITAPQSNEETLPEPVAKPGPKLPTNPSEGNPYYVPVKNAPAWLALTIFFALLLLFMGAGIGIGYAIPRK